MSWFGPPADVTANERACASQVPPFSKDAEDISRALRKTLITIHPDKIANKPLAQEVMHHITLQREGLASNAEANRTKCTKLPATDRERVLQRLAEEAESLKTSIPYASDAADQAANMEAVRQRSRQQAAEDIEQKRKRKAQRGAAEQTGETDPDLRERARKERDRRERLLAHAQAAEEKEEVEFVKEVPAPTNRRGFVR